MPAVFGNPAITDGDHIGVFKGRCGSRFELEPFNDESILYVPTMEHLEGKLLSDYLCRPIDTGRSPKNSKK
jgi:hypothetical protein